MGKSAKKMLAGAIVLVGAATLAIPSCLYAQDLFGQSVASFSGSSDAGITTGSWGSGKCKESTRLTYSGNKVLEITARNLYEGARIDFSKPLDLSRAFANPNGYIQVVSRFSAPTQTGVGAAGGRSRGIPGIGGGAPGVGGIPGIGGGMPGIPGIGGGGGGVPGVGGMPGMGAGVPGVGGMPGMGGMGMPGMPGMGGRGRRTATPTTIAKKYVDRVQMILFTDDGQSVESQVDRSSFERSSDGWTYISFPMAALKNKMGSSSYKVKRIVISGDGTEPFYVGEVRLTEDTTPLQPDAGEDRTVRKGAKITFRGTCNAGASAVKYSWDFDSSDGIQEDTVGSAIKHEFRKAGEYTVTLTAVDIFGLKQSASSTVHVTVVE